ncbi:MAG: cyclodeaminase/cyclohydrolase family protein [Patescibacteria group bacterium]
MIQKQTIKKFLDELGSKSPTPGGGAVAAVSGAMAASLVEMVCVLTKNGGLKNEASKATKIREKLIKLADDDVSAFDGVMKAYRAKNKVQIKKSLKVAMDVPMKVALLSKDIQKLALIVAKKGNKNAYSDAKSAFHLAKAAEASAMENVKINKKALVALG